MIVNNLEFREAHKVIVTEEGILALLLVPCSAGGQTTKLPSRKLRHLIGLFEQRRCVLPGGQTRI